MKIASSAVSLSSEQKNISSSAQYSHLKMWDSSSQKTPHPGFSKDASDHKRHLTDSLEIDQKLIDQSLKNSKSTQKNKDDLDKFLDEFYGDIRLTIFKELIEKFTGKEIKVYHPGNDISSDPTADNAPANSNDNSSNSSDAPKPQGWGLDFSYKETNYSLESFTVEAAGKVTTDTGKEISFSTSLSMSRETYNEFSVSLKAGDALLDPLMINFSGTGAKISNQTFDFDLNFDGVLETISAPSKDSGFLAYDRNGDGVINNGSELFGPSSNNGFSELAAFDTDKNGWIDENDPIFNSLKIWEKDSEGNVTLSSLLQKDVGAIYTGRVDTGYNLFNESGDLNGKLRQSGIWLNEKTGQAGLVQEIDLVI